MKPDISEFSYGYALTSEIATRHSALICGAPEFPSLKSEGSLGYDVKLPLVGDPLFLQFKLSNFMVRKTAQGSGKVGTPHYRMDLRPTKHSDQHILLCDLDAKGYKVYYATPEFHTSADLSDAYLNHTVSARTAFWKPGDIGALPDHNDHFICFATGASHGYLCSEPKQIDRTSSEVVEVLPAVQSPSAKVRERPARDALLGMGDELIAIWTERRQDGFKALPAIQEIRETRDPVEYLGWVARCLFDCVAIIQPARQKATQPPLTQ